jgi:hypothetical protein
VLSSSKPDISLLNRIGTASYLEEVKYGMNYGDIDERFLRRIVGALGLALPVVVMVWGFFLSGWSVQDSLSDYYSLRTRDAFVGILFVIGWFLFAYKGYEKLDNIAGYLACVSALGVAIFPNSGNGWERIVHFSSATCLFLILSFFSLFLFTKTKDSPKGFGPTVLSAFRFGAAKSGNSMTREKKKRNIIYIICGIVMLACIALIGLYMLFWQNTAISNIKPVFYLEWLMIWAFGASWFIKGETILKDK